MKIMADKEYTFLIAYQNENNYRAAFNILTQKVFGISFENWYQAGYWNENYIPYTLFDEGKAIANVSVNVMDFNILGKQQRAIQIGTVLTDEEYRNKSLSRFLMDKVLDEWHEKCDFIYLYANKSVLEMYPKFGFNRVNEYEYFKFVNTSDKSDFVRLNMAMQSDRDKLYEYAKNSHVFSKIAMHENADLVMFYCLSVLKESIYYSKTLDVIAIATFNDNQLLLFDMFSKKEVKLDKVINSLVNPKIDKVILGFTPNDCSSYETREILGDDALFILRDKFKLFDENKIMFPLLSHA